MSSSRIICQAANADDAVLILASFQKQDFKHLTFPVSMYIDYVRVYQRDDITDGVGCDPASRPTADYIQKYVHILPCDLAAPLLTNCLSFSAL